MSFGSRVRAIAGETPALRKIPSHAALKTAALRPPFLACRFEERSDKESAFVRRRRRRFFPSFRAKRPHADAAVFCFRHSERSEESLRCFRLSMQGKTSGEIPRAAQRAALGMTVEKSPYR
jgi:hypothetical protein